jgi:hypothetical protein
MNKQRFTVHFPARAAEKLVSIKRLSRLKSNADLLAVALESYCELVEADRSGCTIRVCRDDGLLECKFSPHTEFHYPSSKQFPEPERSELDRIPKSLVLSDAEAEKIMQIKRLCRIKSTANVIRAALASFDELIKVCHAGDRIFVSNRMGREVAYSPYAPLDRRVLQDEDEPEGVRPRTAQPQGSSMNHNMLEPA